MHKKKQITNMLIIRNVLLILTLFIQVINSFKKHNNYHQFKNYQIYNYNNNNNNNNNDYKTNDIIPLTYQSKLSSSLLLSSSSKISLLLFSLRLIQPNNVNAASNVGKIIIITYYSSYSHH